MNKQEVEASGVERLVMRETCKGCNFLQCSGYAYWCSKKGSSCSSGGIQMKKCKKRLDNRAALRSQRDSPHETKRLRFILLLCAGSNDENRNS